MLSRAIHQIRQNFVAYLALLFAVSGTAMAAKRNDPGVLQGSMGVVHLKGAVVNLGFVTQYIFVLPASAPAAREGPP